jgi:large-conductance mechanosensitive channel
MENTLEVKTPVGALKNVPMSLLGWLVVAGLAAFLVVKMTGSFEDKLTRMSEEMPVQTTILKEIRDALQER